MQRNTNYVFLMREKRAIEALITFPIFNVFHLQFSLQRREGHRASWGCWQNAAV